MTTEKIIHLGHVLGTKILAQNGKKYYFFNFSGVLSVKHRQIDTIML